jgi:hypothetical protein
MIPTRASTRELLCACLLTLFFGPSAFGESAAVPGRSQEAGRADNVQFEVVEGRSVRIFYDLVAGDPNVLLNVRLVVSQDGGQTFDLVPRSVSGAVGPAVAPGRGKEIRWEAARDIERLEVEQLRVRVLVSAIVAQRPRSSWGVSGSFVPDWRMPSGLERVFFALNTTDYRVSGSELRVGVVRGRTDAGDWGFALVMKRVKAGSFVSRSLDIHGFTEVITYTADSLWFTGGEIYKFLPFVRIGDRQQVGIVIAAGVSLQPGGTVERRIDGPVFVSDPYSTSTPQVVPEGPGVMIDDHGSIVNVLPGSRNVIDSVKATRLFDKSIWSSNPQVLGRVELAWALTLSSRARLRVSGGFNFPTVQLFSVELVQFVGR